MEKTLSGVVHIFGDNIDTDQIYPGRYLELTDPKEIALHCLEGADAGFISRSKPGDIVVAGKNFGCGSSREQAAITLKAAGIGMIVAPSFARIFYRNAINLGLPLIICSGILQKVQNGDHITIDMAQGAIFNDTGKKISCEPLSGFVMSILENGGIKSMIRSRYSK